MKFDIAFNHLFMAPMDDPSGVGGGGGGGGSPPAVPLAAAPDNLDNDGDAPIDASDNVAPGEDSNAAPSAAQGGGVVKQAFSFHLAQVSLSSKTIARSKSPTP